MTLITSNTNIKDINYGNVNILKVIKNGEIIWKKKPKTPPISGTCFSFAKNGRNYNGTYYPYKIAMISNNMDIGFSGVQDYKQNLIINVGPGWKKVTLETSKDFKMFLYNYSTSQYTPKTIYAKQKNDITDIINRALIETNSTNVVAYADRDPLWVTATIEFN